MLACPAIVIPLFSRGDSVYFPVKVIPRAGRTAIAGLRQDALLIRLAVAPVDGRANEELIACVAAWLGVPRRQVSIASGERSRTKRLGVTGLTADQIAEKLSAILPA